MRNYGMVTPKRKRKPAQRGEPLGKSDIQNLLKDRCAIRPNAIWAGDFTYLSFHHSTLYLATVIDLYTREVVGWTIRNRHDTALVIAALEEACADRNLPQLFHSDRGSEYDSAAVRDWLTTHHIEISQSAKGSPWQNGHQESFFRTFKKEFSTGQFYFTVDEFTEAIANYIRYYNTARIHSRLKMPPRSFYEQCQRGPRRSNDLRGAREL